MHWFTESTPRGQRASLAATSARLSAHGTACWTPSGGRQHLVCPLSRPPLLPLPPPLPPLPSPALLPLPLPLPPSLLPPQQQQF